MLPLIARYTRSELVFAAAKCCSLSVVSGPIPFACIAAPLPSAAGRGVVALSSRKSTATSASVHACAAPRPPAAAAITPPGAGCTSAASGDISRCSASARCHDVFPQPFFLLSSRFFTSTLHFSGLFPCFSSQLFSIVPGAVPALQASAAAAKPLTANPADPFFGDPASMATTLHPSGGPVSLPNSLPFSCTNAAAPLHSSVYPVAQTRATTACAGDSCAAAASPSATSALFPLSATVSDICATPASTATATSLLKTYCLGAKALSFTDRAADVRYPQVVECSKEPKLPRISEAKSAVSEVQLRLFTQLHAQQSYFQQQCRCFGARTRQQRMEQELQRRSSTVNALQHQQQQQPVSYNKGYDYSSYYGDQRFPHMEGGQRLSLGWQLFIAFISSIAFYCGFILIMRLIGGPHVTAVHVDQYGNPVNPHTGRPFQ